MSEGTDTNGEKYYRLTPKGLVIGFISKHLGKTLFTPEEISVGTHLSLKEVEETMVELSKDGNVVIHEGAEEA